MKKLFFFLTFIFQTSLTTVAWDYIGPDDERIPPGGVGNPLLSTLGYYARMMTVGAVADVIEDVVEEPTRPDYSTGFLKVRIIAPIYGCTNGQEIVLKKPDPKPLSWWPEEVDPNFEYYPTNNSRIVFFADIPISEYDYIKKNPPSWWVPKKWKQQPEPETIVSATSEPWLNEFSRQWWYDGWQDNLPYTHLTNLLHAARVERNWTNYYHIIRDAIPTPTSPRVWQDSFWDMSDLLYFASDEQFEFMMNDPLFPAECREMMQDFYDRPHRYKNLIPLFPYLAEEYE